MKYERGAVTIAVFIAMLIFSLYGIIFYGNSASAYIRQTRTLESIQKTYSGDIANAYKIAEKLGK